VAEVRQETDHGRNDTENTIKRAVKQTERHAASGVQTAVKRGLKILAEDAVETMTHTAAERGVQTLTQGTERGDEAERQRARQAREISATAVAGVARTASRLAAGSQEVFEAWTTYTADVMDNTSRAREALFLSRTISEIIEVQAKLWLDNMQCLLNQGEKLITVGSQMVVSPFEAAREVSGVRVLLGRPGG
jgi:hypothetical protein